MSKSTSLDVDVKCLSADVRGRHIFNLTTPGCYKFVTGVRTKEYTRSIFSRGLQYTSDTYNVLAINEIGDVDVQFTDLIPISTYPQDQVSAVLRWTEKEGVRGRYRVNYATFTGSGGDR